MAEVLNRREVAYVMMKCIEKGTGLKCVDAEHGRYYFVFDHGEDGVIHFRIKGCRGWKFAFWLELDPEHLKRSEGGEDYPAVFFFGQHLHNVDKFKPSRSLFCVELSYKDVEQGMKSYTENPDDTVWEFYDLGTMVNYIHKHPIASYVQDAEEAWMCYQGFLRGFIHGEFVHYKYKLCDWFRDFSTMVRHKPKTWILSKFSIVEECEWVDGNEGGWISHPRYSIILKFKNLYEKEVQNHKECSLFKFFFRKEYKGKSYSNLHIFMSREGLNSRYTYTEK